MARGRTFDQGQRARELFDTGMSCNAIAKQLGFSPSTISGWAKREGLAFNQSQTEDAVQTQRVSRAARRALIIDRLYDRTEKILDRLESEDGYTYRMSFGEGTEVVTDDDPPAADEKSLATAINIYLDRAAKLELVDDGDGVAHVDSMLGRLARRFGLVGDD